MTIAQLLDLIEQRTAEAKARDRALKQSFGKTVSEEVTFSIAEAGEAAELIRTLKAQGTVT